MTITAAINPGATEVCNGVDDNCNQEIDEGGVCSTNSYYCDSDLDTYTSATPTGTCDTFECVPSECTTTQGDDCNDSNSAINPGATEICGNQVDEDCNGSDAQCLSVLINAYKLVCQAETDLPNWGTSGAQKPSVITENTASEYVTSSEGKCQIASGWDFQWGFDGQVTSPTRNQIGSGGTGWNDFNSSTGTSTPAQTIITDLQNSIKIWVKENLKEGYIPFGGDALGDLQNNVSAEMYCNSDILNYDNYDYILNPQLGSTYYCIGFNVLASQTPTETCGDGIVNQTSEQCDNGTQNGSVCTAGYGETCDYCSGTCQTVTVTGPRCGDGIKNGQEECDGTDGVGTNQSCSETCVLVNLPLGTISGHKYNDLDKDGVWDETEPGLGGWNIWFDLDKNGNQNDGDPQTTTDGTNGGLYQFLAVPVDTYDVCEIMDGSHTGWTSINTFCQSVTVTENQTSTANFFNYETAVTPSCGDGIKNGQEECDGTDGVGTNQSCSETCTLTNLLYCGDGSCNNDETCSSCSQDCGSCGGGGGGSSSGGGGGGIIQLSIFNEKNESLTTTQADVSWFTNIIATTRAIYDTVSHSTIGASPNYGYAFSTTQDLNKISFHTVSILGLTPGATYYWRAVATENGFAPEILGTELSFVAPIVAGETIVTEETGENPVVAETPAAPTQEEGVAGATTEEQQTVEPQTLGENTQPEELNSNLFLASIGNFLGNLFGIKCAQINSCCWKLALILTILTGIYLFIREENKKKKIKLGNLKKYFTDLAIGLIIIAALIIWLKCLWLIVPGVLFLLWILKERFMQK